MARTNRKIPSDKAPVDDSAAKIDAAYLAAYSEHPLDEPDEWGDLASFLAATRG